MVTRINWDHFYSQRGVEWHILWCIDYICQFHQKTALLCKRYFVGRSCSCMGWSGNQWERWSWINNHPGRFDETVNLFLIGPIQVPKPIATMPKEGTIFHSNADIQWEFIHQKRHWGISFQLATKFGGKLKSLSNTEPISSEIPSPQVLSWVQTRSTHWTAPAGFVTPRHKVMAEHYPPWNTGALSNKWPSSYFTYMSKQTVRPAKVQTYVPLKHHLEFAGQSHLDLFVIVVKSFMHDVTTILLRSCYSSQAL